MSVLPKPTGDFLVLPTRLAVEHRAYALAASSAVATDHLLVFEDLFSRFGAPPGRRYLSPLGSRLLLRDVLLAAGGLTSERAIDPYAVRAMHRALAELRQAGVTAGHFGARKLSPELAAITTALAAYEQALDQRGLFDDADQQRAAVLHCLQRSSALSLRQVDFAGCSTLFGARLDLLRALVAADVKVRLSVPYDHNRRGLFAWPEASLHQLEASAIEGCELLYDDLSGNGPLNALRQAQGTEHTAVGAPVKLISVSEPSEHAVAAARVVSAWIRAGIAERDIAVVCPDLQQHAPALQRAFRDTGILLRQTQGATLASTRVGHTVRTMLSAPEAGFPREAVIDLWLQRDQAVYPGGEVWAPTRVARLLRDRGVHSTRLGGYRRRLSALTQHPGMAVSQSAVNEIANELEGFMQALLTVVDSADAVAQLTAVTHLVQALVGAGPTIDAAFSLFGAEETSSLHALAHERQAAVVLGELLQSLLQAAAFGGACMSRREVRLWLELLLSEQRLRSATAGATVLLAPPSDIPGSRFAKLLVVGLDVESFPLPDASNPLLGEAQRAEVNALLGPRLLQLGLLSGRAALRADARDWWLWLEVLAAVQDELVVTFTRSAEVEGEQSEVLVELRRSLGQHPMVTLSDVVPATKDASDIGRRAGVAAALMGPRHVVGALDGAARGRLGGDLRDRVWSASQIDQLGVCAFQFFAASVLRLAAVDEPPLGVDARGQGSLVHAALEVVYRHLLTHGGLAVARRDVVAAMTRARAALENERDTLLSRSYAHVLLAQAAVSLAEETALSVLARDLAADDAREPLSLEYRFDDRGNGKAPPLVVDGLAGDVSCLHVRGGIDRIDRVGDGIVAIDYKSRVLRRAEGRHFQLPLYLAVALRDFGRHTATVAASWVSVRDGQHKPAVVVTAPEEFLSGLRSQLSARLRRLASGDVSPDPESDDACQRCDFAALCRYQGASGDDES